MFDARVIFLDKGRNFILWADLLPFFSAFRGPLSGDGLSLEPSIGVFHSQFISITFIHSHIFYTSHPTLSLHIYGAPGIFSHL